jgi:hypothetical protein
MLICKQTELKSALADYDVPRTAQSHSDPPNPIQEHDMAPTSTQQQNGPQQQNGLYPDLDTATDRVRETNERFIEAGRKVTSAYLDGIERYVSGLTQFERQLGAQTQVEAVSSLLNAHAKMTEDVTSATVSAARELIAM